MRIKTGTQGHVRTRCSLCALSLLLDPHDLNRSPLASTRGWDAASVQGISHGPERCRAAGSDLGSFLEPAPPRHLHPERHDNGARRSRAPLATSTATGDAALA